MTMKFSTVPFRPACVAVLLAASAAMAQKAPPRAIPVEDPPPAALPKAVPVEDPNALPKTAPVPPRAEAVVEDTGPKGPDQDLYDYAMLAFGQKDYSIASQSFGKYLQSYPQGRMVPQAMFRLGECYRREGRSDEFQRCYREVEDRFPKSEVAPNAAYRLGEQGRALQADMARLARAGDTKAALATSVTAMVPRWARGPMRPAAALAARVMCPDDPGDMLVIGRAHV